jgi:hypothetical protein
MSDRDERRCVVENVIELAVQDMHSSCNEPSVRAFSRVRPVIPAALNASVQGTTVPTSGAAFGYVMPQTDVSTKALSSGFLAWSPPDR